MEENKERILAAAIYIVSFFTAFIGPLVIWLVKKDESSFIDFHGRAYFNFFISYSIYGFIAGLSMFVLIGILLLPMVGLAMTVFTIIGAVKAFEGKPYKIPLTIQFLK